MRVLICGSRHFTDYKLLAETINGLSFTPSEIIEGEARGADRLGREYAERRSIPVRSFPADWEKYGRAAGPIRNTQMLREGKPDFVVAFLGPNSRGTKHMIEIAQKANIPVRIVPIGQLPIGPQSP